MAKIVNACKDNPQKIIVVVDPSIAMKLEAYLTSLSLKVPNEIYIHSDIAQRLVYASDRRWFAKKFADYVEPGMPSLDQFELSLQKAKDDIIYANNDGLQNLVAP